MLRREPLVALVHDFASEHECAMLRARSGETAEMERAHTGGQRGQGGVVDEYRRAYSTNVDVDVFDAASPLTRSLAERRAGPETGRLRVVVPTARRGTPRHLEQARRRAPAGVRDATVVARRASDGPPWHATRHLLARRAPAGEA